jgi:hypothetical protein
VKPYQEFIARKSQIVGMSGFEPVWMPDFLFDFQRALVEWSIRKGRAAIFADTGLGKTPMQLVWAENVARKAGRPVLILTPLAVSVQTSREGEKFGIECKVSRDGKIASRITITNYERVHYFNADDFAGVVCDESSVLKAFDGKRRKAVTRFLSHIPYRLLCTATAAPNDFIELGTASEALGEMTQSDMLSMFFRASDNARHSLFREGDFWNRPKWFFRAHSELPFWRWVCSWARAIRKPEDLGFDGSRFRLPPLNIKQHVIERAFIPDGELFPTVARTLRQQRDERQRTVDERCEMVAGLVNHDRPSLVWCQYNREGNVLEKMIPDSVQVAGCDTDEDKEDRLDAFALGKVRVLVTKPRVACWGMNYQHCAHQTFFPSHSFEQWYQAIRRSWRFGQEHPVYIDIVSTKGEAGVTANLKKKQDKADQMFSALVAEMNHSRVIEQNEKHVNPMELPAWL